MPPVYLYVLIDPETAAIRYIGKALDPNKRYRKHLMPCYLKDGTYRSRWLQHLVSRGLKPRQVIIDVVPFDDWQDAERRYIATYRALGCPLTNASDGGEQGAYLFTPEARAKISAAWKGRKRSPESVARSANSRRGQPVSDATRAKLSAAMTGKQQRPEDIAKRVQAHVGKPLSLEHRVKLSEAAKRRPQPAPISEETRARLSAAHKGKPKSPAHVAKVAAALKARGERLRAQRAQGDDDGNVLQCARPGGVVGVRSP